MKKKQTGMHQKNTKSETSNIVTLIEKALALHQSESLDAAGQAYVSILSNYPQQPDALHYLGVICHQKGDHAQAESLIRQAIAIHAIAQMYKNLAVVLSAAGRKPEAIEVLQAAANRFPDDASLLFSLSGLQREVGNWESSRDTLTQALGLKPDWPEALMNLANAEKNLGNIEEAEALYRKSLEIKPDFPEALSNLGALCSELGRLDEALAYNSKAVTLAAFYPPFHYNLGNTFLAMGRSSEAEKCFSEAVRIDPNYVNALLNLAASRQQAGDIEGALEINRRVEAIDHSQAKLYINMGSLALNLKRYEDALAFLKRGITLEPDSFTAWSTGAEVLRQLGRIDDARTAITKALTFEPRYGRALLMLATIEEMANRYEAAERALQLALEKPDHLGLHGNAADRRAEARFRLANLYTSLGKEEAAKAAFKDGLSVLSEMRPHLMPFVDEQEECGRPLILFQPIGRAGSLFVHSLLDGHPDIATTPAILMKGFFGEGVWEGMSPDWRVPNQGWQEKIVDRFCDLYGPMLDADSPLPVPGNPLGEPSNVAAGCGLRKLGPQQNQVLKINVLGFKENLKSRLAGLEKISAPMFFRVVHRVWEETLGRSDDKSVLFFHIHNPDVIELAATLMGNSNVKFLNIVRAPLQAVESWMKLCVEGLTTAEELLNGYQSAIERFQLTIRQASHLTYRIYDSTTIRLEDIKRQPDKALAALAAWMEVEDHPCLRESTFAGLEYDAPASTPVKGFETSNLDRKPGALFSDHDQRVMNLLLYPIAVQYGYREADPAYLKREIAWYKPLISESLDFEKKILSQLVAMGYQKDTSGPRRHFESIAQRCINLLEKFGTYPAMAPWLKVD